MCYEDENNCNSIGTKHNSLSLNELLRNNFEVNYNIKDEIHDLMSKSPYLWKNRPIPYKLNYYAGCDVLYLPKMYDLIVKKYEKKIFRKVTIDKIFQECEKYLQYLKMNKNIKNYNKMNLTKGTKIKGLIKNMQHHCVYVQLNIGYIGIVDIYSSVQLMIEKYQLGDIVDFTIIDIENKKKRMMLDIVDKQKETKENVEDKKINIINNTENININTNSSNLLVQNLNINKERFFPKSYIQNIKNGINYNYNIYQNKGYDNNVESYYKDNETQKNYMNNVILNNEILNNNYNGLFYNDKENYYYYDKNDDNNEDNENANSDSYYYTLKPFPK
jgi:predicted RNA-binding protein with RPS1 domain